MSLTWGEKPPGEPVLRRLRLVDAPRCHALTQAVGWGTSLLSWEHILRWGGRHCYGLEQDGELIATTTAICYGRDRAWIGMVLTHPDYRGRGHARRLMQVALEALQQRGVRHILLDASLMGRPLYEKLGFQAMYSVEVWTGRASSYLGPRARPLRDADLAAVIALDADVFGAPRERILRRIVADSPHLAWVDDESGQLDGFILGQAAPESITLGPWTARSPWSAEKLLKTALSVLIGQPVQLRISDQNAQAPVFAHTHDLRYDRHCTRMIYGKVDPPPEILADCYGILSFATG